MVYRERSSLGVGISLLHMWAWEHLPATWHVSLRVGVGDQPYVYMYGGMMSQPHLGRLDWWWRALDDLDIVIWRPYIEFGPWEDDAEVFSYVFMIWFLIGRTTYNMER